MKAKLDMTAAAVTRRLEQAAKLSDLRVERALEGKVSLAAEAVSARLRVVSELRKLGLRLKGLGTRSA
jgi:hypothetical protein